MLWDMSQAYANDRYDVSIKNALTAAGGTGFTFPPCSAPAFVQGQSYTGGSQVSFDGCVLSFLRTDHSLTLGKATFGRPNSLPMTLRQMIQTVTGVLVRIGLAKMWP